jgi:ribosomal protein S27AE
VSDDILKKLEQRVDRRGFLRGSALAAATIAGATAFPAAAGQDQKPDEKPKPTPEPEKKEEKPEGPESKDEPDPFKVTKKDAQGRDYRMCPQCGYNMYQQDRTWTCENCGYSYIE